MELDMKQIKRDSLSSIRYLIVAGIITRILLYYKAGLIQKYFGINEDILKYNMVFAEMILAIEFLSDGISDVLIRLYRKIEEREGVDSLFNHINSLVNIIILGLGGVLIFVAIIALYRKAENLKLILIGLPIILISIMTVIINSFLQMRHGFVSVGKGRVYRALIYVIYLLFLGNKYGVLGLMAVGSLASISQLYIGYNRASGEGYNYLYEFRINFEDEYILEMFEKIFLVTLAVIIYHMSLSGKHSNIFIKYFNGIVISSFVIVTYPLLAEMDERVIIGRDKTFANFNSIFNQMLVFLLKLLIPIGGIMLILSDLGKTIFIKDSILDGNLFIHYGIGIICFSLMPFLFKTLTAIEEIKEITLITILSFLGGRLISMIHIPILKEIGWEIGLFLGVLVSLWIINKETGFIRDTNLKKSLKDLFKAGLTMMGVFVFMKMGYSYLFKDLIENPLISYLIIIIPGIFIYINLLYGNFIKKLIKG